MSEAIVYRVPVNHMQPAELRPSETGYDVVMIEHYQALRDEVARLRGIMEEAASAPGKDWLEWQLKLGAALTPQGKGQQVLKSGQSQEISSYAEGKGGGNG